MNLTERISLLEFVWTLVALVGLIASAYALGDALNDRRALRRAADADELDHILMASIVRNEQYRLATFLIYISVGAGAMLVTDGPWNPYRVLVGLGLLAVNIGGVVNLVKDRAVKKWLLRRNDEVS